MLELGLRIAASPPTASHLQLVTAALLAIVLLVVLITWLRLHPFLSLTIGALLVGALAQRQTSAVLASFAKGVGDTVAGVGMLIALGAMFGRLLADSGGADVLVETLVRRASRASLPWVMAGVGALIGLPMFFEIGLVLLMPVIFLVARRAALPLLRVGIPALAGLSAMHGLVPPHPGPLVAVQALEADLGLTLGLGTLVAIPAVVVAGPLFSGWAARWVDVAPPALFEAARTEQPALSRPSFLVTLATVLLPVLLMMGKALVDLLLPAGHSLRDALDLAGTPMLALLIAVLVAIGTLGRGAALDRRALARSIEASLPPIAGILLIVAAGGGFKQTLLDSGIGDVVTQLVRESGASPLLLAWLVAVLIRLATGSATVATVTAAGMLAPLRSGLGAGEVSLLVLAIGAGSLFFSHVNDAGFWLVKEYFGLSVAQNLKSWSLMETILSVLGLLLVLLLRPFV